MRKIQLTLLLCVVMLISSVSVVQAVDFAWDDPNPEGRVIGALLFFHPKDDPLDLYVVRIPAGQTTAHVDDNVLAPGTTYVFWCEVYNNDGSSGPSEKLDYTTGNYVPPAARLPPVYVHDPPTPTSQFVLQ